jgi:uncharacterized NAD(P)/FAD-binding protein YdhS
VDGAGGSCSTLTVAIIGGGFTGAAIALQLSRQVPTARLLVFEPRPEIGPGLAYSTDDAACRINAQAARMSMLPDDASHFTRWIAASGQCSADTEAALPDGRVFPRRNVFGRYVADQIVPLLESGRVIHHQSVVEDVAWQQGAWRISCTKAAPMRADIVILATGHAPPCLPPVLAGVAGQPCCIADPLAPGALAAIGQGDEVLIIGSGLTMADIVASLDRAGHTGRILSISRRGQAPRPHAGYEQPPCGDYTDAPATALALVRRVRADAVRAVNSGLPWQSVFDAIRRQGQLIWSKLPDTERQRFLRHARPFWDAHRYRLPPATELTLQKRMDDGTLQIAAARLCGAQYADGRFAVTLRQRGATDSKQYGFDAIIVTTGPGRSSGLVAKLARAGVLVEDCTGLGFTCNAPGLYLAGPLSRGRLGEMIAVPEIARQAAAIAAEVSTSFCEQKEAKKL